MSITWNKKTYPCQQWCGDQTERRCLDPNYRAMMDAWHELYRSETRLISANDDEYMRVTGPLRAEYERLRADYERTPRGAWLRRSPAAPSHSPVMLLPSEARRLIA